MLKALDKCGSTNLHDAHGMFCYIMIWNAKNQLWACERHSMHWITISNLVFPILHPASRDLLAAFSDLQSFTRKQLLTLTDTYLHLSHLTPSATGILSSYRAHSWYGKTRMAGLQSGEGHMIIDSVVWAQYTNMSDTPTHRQLRHHSNSHPAKTELFKWAC